MRPPLAVVSLAAVISAALAAAPALTPGALSDPKGVQQDNAYTSKTTLPAVPGSEPSGPGSASSSRQQAPSVEASAQGASPGDTRVAVLGGSPSINSGPRVPPQPGAAHGGSKPTGRPHSSTGPTLPASAPGRIKSQAGDPPRVPSGLRAPGSMPSLALGTARSPAGEGRAIQWKPRRNKYLLLFCGFGRLSNQVACMKRTVRLAVLLNRTLLVPPAGFLMFQGHVQETWAMDTVLDVRRMASCLRPAYGGNTIITFADYFARHNLTKVVVDRLDCAAVGPPENCAHPLRIAALSNAVGPTLQLPPLQEYPKWLVASALPPGRVAREWEVVAAYRGRQQEVLCAGEMFGMLYDTPSSAFSLSRPPSCNNLWQPSQHITRFIHGLFRKTFKSHPFAALHLRRGDFYRESVLARKKNLLKSGYYHYSSIVDAAKVMAGRLLELKVKTLYIATDASNTEFRLFKTILKEHCQVGRIVSLKDLQQNPAWLARQSWAQGALRLANSSTTGIPWVLAEKGICAQASVFLGTMSSSFSMDITDMRCDERRHHGQDPTSLMCSVKGCEPITC